MGCLWVTQTLTHTRTHTRSIRMHGIAIGHYQLSTLQMIDRCNVIMTCGLCTKSKHDDIGLSEPRTNKIKRLTLNAYTASNSDQHTVG